MNNDQEPKREEPVSQSEQSVRLALFDQYRGLLFSIAYRMLGSVSDAEDMLQETYLRWQGLGQEEIRSPRAYLVTIVSRLCITHLQSARVQREEYMGVWLPEPILTDPGNGPFQLIKIDETLSMAFLVLLERLTAVERAVFLLKEVFEYDYKEIAAVIGQNETYCRQILKRAKEHIATLRPRFTVKQPERDALLEGFLKATSTGEMADLLALLTNDVVLRSDGGGKGVAVPNEVHGPDKVSRGVLSGLKRLVPQNMIRKLARINGQSGLVNYLNGKPHSVLTIESREGKICSIYVITNPEKLKHLPPLESSAPTVTK